MSYGLGTLLRREAVLIYRKAHRPSLIALSSGTHSALRQRPCSGLTPRRRHMERNSNDTFGNQNSGDAASGGGFGGTGGSGSQAGSQGTNASGTGGFGGSTGANMGTSG